MFKNKLEMNLILKTKIIASALINSVTRYKNVNGIIYKMPKSVSLAFRPIVKNVVEECEVQIIRQRCSGANNAVDVGANVGLLSLEMARLVNASVYCFEPNPYTFSKLVDTISMNAHGLPKIHLTCAAVGEKSGFSNFFTSNRDYLGVMSSQIQTDPGSQRIKVPMISLDEYFSDEVVKIDFIKIDVEGAELFVLKGAINRLKKDSPDVLVEIHGPFLDQFGYSVHDVFEFMKQNCYSAFSVQTGRSITVENFLVNSGKMVLHPISGDDMSKKGYGSVLFSKK